MDIGGRAPPINDAFRDLGNSFPAYAGRVE
jgi:hypothetical protein